MTLFWFFVAAVLFVLWLVCLFMLVVDELGVGAKVLWFLALTLLAPVAIPVYLITRSRRRAAAA